MIFFIIFLCHGARGNWFTDKLVDFGAEAVGFSISDTCGFTRAQGLQCIKDHVDFNKNGHISCEEFERAKALYLPPRLRYALSLARKLGMDIHFDQVLYGCDTDRNCIFEERDWTDSTKTCLPFPADLCKLQTVCKIAETSTEEFTAADWARAKETCKPYDDKENCVRLEKQWDEDDLKKKQKK